MSDQDDLKALRLAAGDLEATFVPAAACVGASLTHRGDELLAPRAGLDAYVRTGATMGLPLLHPWANRLGRLGYAVGGRTVALDPERMPVRLDGNGLPMHGVRGGALRFEVVASTATELHTRLEFDDAELLAVFPFPHELETHIALSPGGLEVRTALRPTGDVAVPVSFGYHPYLTLPGVPRHAWEVGIPAARRIVVDERQVPTDGREEVGAWTGALGDRAFDDGYDRLGEPAVFTLRGGGRALAVRFVEGYTHAQVFAPPGQALIAFEPMTAPADALNSHAGLRLVAPGETFAAAFALDVSAS